MMDIFFETLDIEKKKGFTHRFMKSLHEDLTKLRPKDLSRKLQKIYPLILLFFVLMNFM